ncbi:hypothetical protein LEP1GSC051_0028, partial [Leptospira sp. P2653]
AENYLASLYLASSIIVFNFLIGSFETGSKFCIMTMGYDCYIFSTLLFYRDE